MLQLIDDEATQLNALRACSSEAFSLEEHLFEGPFGGLKALKGYEKLF